MAIQNRIAKGKSALIVGRRKNSHRMSCFSSKRKGDRFKELCPVQKGKQQQLMKSRKSMFTELHEACISHISESTEVDTFA